MATRQPGQGNSALGFGRWKSLTVALGLALVLAACGGKGAKTEVAEDGTVITQTAGDRAAAERREQRREEAQAERDKTFTYFRYRVDTNGDQPVACLVFSAPLDSQRDYSPFLEFRPNFPAALSVQGRDLCIGGLTFGSERSVTLLAGLPAADGRTLKREETFPISFDDRPPYVGFKGAGIVLPRAESDGLPIETVNVREVEVTVSRVNDRALAFKRVGSGEQVGQGRYSYVWGENDPSDVSEEIFKGTMKIKSVDNAPVVTVFPMKETVGVLKPGAYYVRVVDAAKLNDNEGPAASATRWIMLTDLAITAYEGEHGLDVTLRSLRDGKTVRNATVQLIAQSNAVLAEAQSDGQGRVTFDKPLTAGQGAMAARMVLARNGAGELALLDLQRSPVDLSEHDISGRGVAGDVDAFVYAERGIYRPGERVELVGLLRDRAGRQITGRKGHLIVYRPNGLEAAKVRFDDPKAGAVDHTYVLPKGAARGEWRAALQVDGISGDVGDVRFAVEDFVPQRLAVKVDANEKTVMTGKGARAVTIDSRFLYGAPGAGLTVSTEARVELDPSPFKAFEGFTFGRADQVFYEEMVEIDDVTTDGAGRASVRLGPSEAGKGSGRPLRFNAVVSVLEPGGRAVTESARIPYRPDPIYIGIKPDFDSQVEEGGKASFEVASVNPAGKGVAHKLKWQLLQIDEHYDWFREGGDWNWRVSRTATKVNEGVISTNASGAAKIDVAGFSWGPHQLIVESVSAGVSSSSEFYAGWGGQVSPDGVEAPDRVRVAGPVKAPGVGRAFDVNIDAPYAGQAQVVVATDRVLSVENIAVKAGPSRVRLTPTEAWGEGAYVMVTVFTARNPDRDPKPRRAVGVSYVPLDMSSRTLNLALDAPDIARPNTKQRVNLTLTGDTRDPVYVTIAAVDEGILQLTKFKSPNPVEHYYGRKALSVQLYDDYGRLIDPNMGMASDVRSGGDQLGGEGLSVVPVKTVALFKGIIDAGRTGKASVELDLPAFNGELRLMAVAWSKAAVGSAEDKMVVRDKAPSELVMPRFLAPGDEAFLTASVDNIELGNGQFTSAFSGKGPVQVADAKFTRTVSKGQRVDAPVRVRANTEGLSRLSMVVTGPDQFAVSRTFDLQTRSPYLPETRATSRLLQPGEKMSVSADLLKGYLPGSAEVTVGFSRLPVDPATLYASLDRYPYGCTEQTTSRAMPLLYSEQLVAMGAKGSRDKARDKVQVAVNTLLSRQSGDGAFGLWREGDGYATPWLGAYTTDFLVRAKEQKYVVPQESLDRAYDALRTVSTGESWRVYGYDTNVYTWGESNESEQQMMYRASAYALYVLARGGETSIARLRYLHDREIDAIASPLARAHIGAGLALLGDRARAASAFRKAEAALGYQNDADYYQTPLRDAAAILALAAESDMTDAVKRLATRLGRDTPEANMLTTQEKSFMLLAVNGLTKGEPSPTVKVLGLGAGKDNQTQYLISAAQLKSGVSFELTGKAPLFQTVLVTGAPASPPPAAGERLNASKRLFTLTGGAVDAGRIRQGDRIVVGLTVTPDERRLVPLIVADLLPAGFEIETVLRPADGASADGVAGAFSFLGELSYPQTQQAQDDRFVAAIDVTGNPVRLGYIARAVTPGNFAIPGVVAEDMYRPEVFARSAPGRVTISAETNPATGGR